MTAAMIVFLNTQQFCANLCVYQPFLIILSKQAKTKSKLHLFGRLDYNVTVKMSFWFHKQKTTRHHEWKQCIKIKVTTDVTAKH